MGLDRMRELLSALGDPQRCCPVVHVAGTNGKGSVVRLVASALRAQGLRVGEYISPHLQEVNERIALEGRDISDAELDALLCELDARCQGWGPEGEGALTYFEMMTAAAFLHFQRRRAQVAVVEVGMGGRLDATSVVDPAVTVITSIGLDHMEQLGPDVASIAGEKAGIIRPGRPVVVGPLPGEALRVVRAVAAERDAPLWVAGQDFRYHRDREGRLSWSGGGREIEGLPLTLEGDHQVDNAAVAVASLLVSGITVGEPGLRQGLSAVRHAGRIERAAPDLVLDCAHNADGATTLAAWLRAQPRDRPRRLLLGMSADKECLSVARALAPQVDELWTTRCAHPRAADPAELALLLGGLLPRPQAAGPIEEALPAARDGEALVIVAGSVFLVGAARDLLGLR
jgi:dihydrofolate synthase / folylpolyglutamate synthase